MKLDTVEKLLCIVDDVVARREPDFETLLECRTHLLHDQKVLIQRRKRMCRLNAEEVKGGVSCEMIREALNARQKAQKGEYYQEAHEAAVKALEAGGTEDDSEKAADEVMNPSGFGGTRRTEMTSTEM